MAAPPLGAWPSWSLQDLLADMRRRRLARGRNYLHRVSAISAPLFDMEHFWGVLTALGPHSRFRYGWCGDVARGLHASKNSGRRTPGCTGRGGAVRRRQPSRPRQR